ncbi:MAG TPA: ATP-binding cassette domain-containing protein, partial [Limnochordales bacterium]
QALRESLPRLSGDEVASALQVLQQAGADPLTAPAGVELVLQGRRLPPAEAVGRVVREALGLEQGRVYTAPAAAASPSARAAVMGVARRAASAGAALATAVLVLWTLLNDWAAYAALVQAARRGRAGPPGAAARLTALTGALAGTALGFGAAALALGPGDPLVLAALAGAGAAGGAAAGRWGPRLSPVDADAVEAALAAGLEAGAVLEAVVAPSARPWLLAWTAARRPPRPPAASPARRAGSPAPALRVRPVSAPEPPSADPAGPVLEAEGLVRRFGRQTVLDGVSLSVARGETVVLMGPSGCGKSTLLRCLKGLVQPDAGTVRIDGRDLWALPASRRRALAARVGMVFQRPQLVPHLSVLENAALGAAASGVPWPEAYERAAAWLAALELGHLLDRRPAELSGGEGQRVAIARALAAAPEIVLWDEPTAHLDPMLAADLLQLMEELIRRLRTTMLVVTHQPGFTARVGDRLILMEHGRVVESGPPARVLAQPASEVGRRLARLAAV